MNYKYILYIDICIHPSLIREGCIHMGGVYIREKVKKNKQFLYSVGGCLGCLYSLFIVTNISTLFEIAKTINSINIH